MNAFQSRQDIAKLIEEVERLKFHLDGSGVYMATKASPGIIPEIRMSTILMSAINEISLTNNKNPLHVMVNKIPAGITAPVHTDTVLGDPIRWHLPLLTNEGCFWWDEINNLLQMKPGVWYGPVPYKSRHTVGNFGTTERIHLVVDLEGPYE